MTAWLAEFKAELSSHKWFSIACGLCMLSPLLEDLGVTCECCGESYFGIPPQEWLELVQSVLDTLSPYARRQIRRYFLRDIKIHEQEGPFDDKPYPRTLVCADAEYARELVNLLK